MAHDLVLPVAENLQHLLPSRGKHQLHDRPPL